ncbi:hypothetical protein PF004_g28429 [Phytophthora fragariae]|uniref:Uncharacterized protein n=1 Tax=Phytophthora fragariae TaxID=53985 RepID=A0A6G0MIG6_9STRA|nr:hypothetical protein PF004_g28429 [Phytophthora fragariae]
MLDVALEPTCERAERRITRREEKCFSCLGELPPWLSRVQRLDIGRVTRARFQFAGSGVARRGMIQPGGGRKSVRNSCTPDGVPAGGITGSKKGTAGELPAEPLEAALEDEARDDEEVDESSPLESPEPPGPGLDPRSLPCGPSAKSAPAAPGTRNAPTPPNVSTPGKPNVSASANQIVDAEACGNATANEEADVPETSNETQGHSTGDAWTGPAALDRRCLKTRNRRAPRPLGARRSCSGRRERSSGRSVRSSAGRSRSVGYRGGPPATSEGRRTGRRSGRRS